MTGMTTEPKGSKPSPKAKKPKPDWERIELDYRAGVKSLREIAANAGVSHVTISKRAKKYGWTKDLSKKIQSKADELVNRGEVNERVNTVSEISEQETIDANAQAVADVKRTHRQDIQRARKATMGLLEELEHMIGVETVQLLEQLGMMMRQENDKGHDRLNDLYHKIISLPGRSKTMKELSDSLTKLVGLERQAFGMDDKDTRPADSLTTLLNSIAQNSNSSFQPVTDDPEQLPEPPDSALPMSAEPED